MCACRCGRAAASGAVDEVSCGRIALDLRLAVFWLALLGQTHRKTADGVLHSLRGCARKRVGACKVACAQQHTCITRRRLRWANYYLHILAVPDTQKAICEQGLHKSSQSRRRIWEGVVLCRGCASAACTEPRLRMPSAARSRWQMLGRRNGITAHRRSITLMCASVLGMHLSRKQMKSQMPLQLCRAFQRKRRGC